MWVQLLVMVVLSVISYLLTPKPKVQTPTAGNLSGVATIEDTQNLAVLFGTHELTAPNVVWYGDFFTTPITTKSGGKK